MKRPVKIQVVAFNVPFPPDYGGVMDVFYKLKALHGMGVDIILHCFAYGRPPAPALEEICKRVYYYPRVLSPFKLIGPKPFIVSTRNNPSLLKNMVSEGVPILFEGLHCCNFLGNPALWNLPVVVRAHNIEHAYYRALAQAQAFGFRRFYFSREARKLESFEGILSKAGAIAAISEGDANQLKSRYPQTFHIPAFHPFDVVESIPGTGQYILFHGNLGVPENLLSLRFILKEIMPGLGFPLIVAGKNPPPSLVRVLRNQPNTRLIANPTAPEIEELVKNAQVCLLHTHQSTGLKLKLLYALFTGRHVVANSTMVEGTGLEDLCHVASTPAGFRQLVVSKMTEPFPLSEIQKRIQILPHRFGNQNNASRLLDLFSLSV